MTRSDPHFAVNRRRALMTFGAVWTTLAAPAGAAAEGVLNWAPRALTVDQARTLEALAELIFPETDTPGARAAGVAPFVDRAVAAYCTVDDAASLRTGLDRIDADARSGHGTTFAGLASDQQAALFSRYEAGGGGPGSARFVTLMKELTTVGYFTSEVGGTKAVRYDPVPGDFRGCVPLSEIGRAWAL